MSEKLYTESTEGALRAYACRGSESVPQFTRIR